MNRRDIILISVLINAGLLTALFVASIRFDESEPSNQGIAQEKPEKASEILPVSYDIAEVPRDAVEDTNFELPIDEVDHVLKEFSPDMAGDRSNSTSSSGNDDEFVSSSAEQSPVETSSQPENWVQITVKRGDALEKIARANRTTVEMIKSANQLKSDKLKVGQILKIPVGASPKEKTEVKEKSPSGSQEVAEAVYYTVKPGDNPWKIAKQFNVRFEDLLKLNQLNEAKAKNLKVGDKLRVK